MSSDEKPPEDADDLDGDDAVDDAVDKAMIDRDDDGFNHPLAAEDNAPDPGYAAFSKDFDDPLENWPGPDSSTLMQNSAENDYVDDFLEDLDEPEHKNLSAPSSVLPEPGPEPKPDDENSALRQDADRHTEVESEGSDHSIPIVMIAALVGALALLAFGGYGVIQQRESMQAQIRELQASLATALTPAELNAARERQRELEVDYEALNADFNALVAENQRLRAELLAQRDLASPVVMAAQDPVDDGIATVSASEETTDKQTDMGAEASTLDSTLDSTSAGTIADTVKSSGWFVNFGSYTLRELADQWAARLDVAQGTVTVQTANTNDGTLYRVRVVGLPTRDDAERVATRLERKFDTPRLWIGRQTP